MEAIIKENDFEAYEKDRKWRATLTNNLLKTYHLIFNYVLETKQLKNQQF